MAKKRATAVAIVMATHFPQTLAMVALATIASAALGTSGWQLVLVALAVLCGQVTVGWTNDFIDSAIDQKLKREHKPVVRDELDVDQLRLPIAIAAVLVVPLSILAAGPWGGLAHLIAVSSAWSYNFKLDRTPYSWVPYAVAFLMLPIFVFQSASRDLWPSLGIYLIAVIVGIVSHLINAYPDIELDRRANLGGAAVSLGKRNTLVVVGLLVSAGLIYLYFNFADLISSF